MRRHWTWSHRLSALAQPGRRLSPGLTTGGRWGRPQPSRSLAGRRPPAIRLRPLAGSVQKRERAGRGLTSVPLWLRWGLQEQGIVQDLGGREATRGSRCSGLRGRQSGWGPSGSEQWCPPGTRRPGMRGPECRRLGHLALLRPRVRLTPGGLGVGVCRAAAAPGGTVCWPGEISKVLRWPEEGKAQGRGKGGPEDRVPRRAPLPGRCLLATGSVRPHGPTAAGI